MVVGLLDEEEKNYLAIRYYKQYKIFTPLLDSNNNWVLPLYQILENSNLDCWWVKYLPLIDFKKPQSNNK